MNVARRRMLLALTAAGLTVPAAIRMALAQQMPGDNTPGTQGVRDLKGDVRVNGRRARLDTPVMPGDRVTAGRNAMAMFVVGQDAFLVRGATRLELSGTDALITTARVLTGRLLGVFATGHERRILTPSATIGIRGTGGYIEAQRGRTYFCLCYGTADIASASGAATDSYSTTHHESPRYIYGDRRADAIVPANVANHTDDELIMLEALVGRRPSQAFMDSPQKY